MKRKQIYQNLHPFASHPFEAFCWESWHPVEQLSIVGGVMTAKIVRNNATVEEEIPNSHLRVRSRKAVLADCAYFLRQGIDVCVSTTLQDKEGTDDDEDDSSEPVWLDAKIRSMKRLEHDEVGCRCEFYVSFYLEQGPGLVPGNKKLSRETSTVRLDEISVLQRLEQNPSDGEFYRWGFSEDCFFSQKQKLFSGNFLSDISWLLVASALKQAAFDVVTAQNRLVYKIARSTHHRSHALNFRVENDVSTPVVLPIVAAASGKDGDEAEACDDVVELRRSKRRIVQPDRYMGYDKNIPDYDMEVTRLGEGKPQYYEISSDSSESEDESDEEKPFSRLSVQADNEYRSARDWHDQHRKRKVRLNSLFYKRVRESVVRQRKVYERSCRTQMDCSDRAHKKEYEEYDVGLDENGFPNIKMPRANEEIGRIVDRYFYLKKSGKKKSIDSDFMDMEGASSSSSWAWTKKPIVPRKKYTRAGKFGFNKRDCYYVRDSIYDVRSFRKDSVTAQVCRELIRKCMLNIDSVLKNGPDQSGVVDRFRSDEAATKEKAAAEERADVNSDGEEESSEIGMLWKEMDIAMSSWYINDDNEELRVEPEVEAAKHGREIREEICKHDLRLDDEVGMVCERCGFVETDIKDIFPPFAKPTSRTKKREKHETGDKTDPTSSKNENKELDDRLSVPAAPTTTPSNSCRREKNVWALIPELEHKLRPHQRKAFAFLWRNIAGSLVPSRMEKRKDKTGGCVVSHTPGAGKTLLIIAFLVSYLKLYPGSRPLVLAPKTTLYTWYKEIIKWNVGVPVYQIHGGQTYKGEVLKQRIRLAPGLPRNQDVMHVVDSLEKMQCWLSHPSILLMGYTSFLTLTREDSPYVHRKYMAQLLKQCPGILILDEGHNPRSTKSRLRKGLMKVNTRLRILLSGTLFQNNFGEYFNTLNLARPTFAEEVIDVLDPKYDKTDKSVVSLENRGRKLLIDKVSKKIDSKAGNERAQALRTLKKLTSKFIDSYEGGSSTEELPGLECYTLMMKASDFQLDILSTLQDKRSEQSKFPLDVEFLITLSAIHPWLITTSRCSRTYFSDAELEGLERLKFDVRCGSKVRFVMRLIPRCLFRNEKVLIFCHNISPINLFLQIFERFYGWRKGYEVLVLQGDIELFERGRVIDRFEEPNGPSKVMLASITACAEGISLTAASRVILLDSEWNPAKSKQAIARAFRPGQSKVVYVYQLLATGTLEEEKHSRTTWKEWVSDMIFSDELVEDPSHWQAPKMEDELLREIVEEDRAALFHKIMKNEKASNVIRGKGLLKNDVS